MNVLSEIRQTSGFLSIFKSFFSLLMGDSSLKPIGEMSDALVKTKAFTLAAQHLRKNPDCARLLESRYMGPPHNVEELLQYPEDSLGYIYAVYLKTHGLSPDLHSGMKINSDASYVEARLSQTHDIWHIVTGFDTSSIGEIGLQAFHLPQFPYPLASLLVANSLVGITLFTPEDLPPLLNAIAKGWSLGSQAKPLFAQKWEEAWDLPLSQWRKNLNIQETVLK